MRERRKSITIYILSAMIPILIFFLASFILGYLPLGENTFEIFDAKEQYAGFIMALKSGNIFHSWSGGLGFNLLASLYYYAGSPLNWFMLFSNVANYSYVFAGLTFVRIGLLGLAMSFYLQKKRLKDIHVILLSTAYALMGFTSAYYYNFIWIDSIAMLPLVFYGLENLLEGKKGTFYVISLAISIICNYYIGYMICLFTFIYFLSRLFVSSERIGLTKRYLKTTFLAILLCSLVIIPSIFSLLNGKVDHLPMTDFRGISGDAYRLPYIFTAGSTLKNSFRLHGVAQVYTSILVLALAILYFFKSDITKKEKISSGVVLALLYLSLSLNGLNYVWHLFREPIWWSSRFSFVISFFMIKLASDALKGKTIDFSLKKRIAILSGASIVILLSSFVVFMRNTSIDYKNLWFLLLSILLLSIYILFIGKKWTNIIMLTLILDVGINAYNNLKMNLYAYDGIVNESEIAKFDEALKKLKNDDDSFYRIERTSNYSANDGLYFGYPSISYFDSVSDSKMSRFLKSIGLEATGPLIAFYRSGYSNPIKIDPVVMSLLNVKYVEGDIEYLEEIGKNLYLNPYPLSIGFMAKEGIKNVELSYDEEPTLLTTCENTEKLLEAMTDLDLVLYKTVSKSEFKETKEEFVYEAKVKENMLLLVPNLRRFTISINGKNRTIDNYLEIKRGDKLKVSIPKEGNDLDEVYLSLMVIDEYEKAMKTLQESLLEIEKDSKSVLKGKIDVQKEGVLFLSVSYLDGMEVFVDGEKTTHFQVADTLVGVDLSKGVHEIELKYVPKGLKMGIILSLIGLTWAFIGWYTKKL